MGRVVVLVLVLVLTCLSWSCPSLCPSEPPFMCVRDLVSVLSFVLVHKSHFCPCKLVLVLISLSLFMSLRRAVLDSSHSLSVCVSVCLSLSSPPVERTGGLSL